MSKKSKWDYDDLSLALEEVNENNMSIRGAAKLFGMSEGMIRLANKKKSLGLTHGDGVIGRPTVLTSKEECDLSNCILYICRIGFSPSTEQIKDYVQEYIIKHKITNPFNNDRPGKHWVTNFMKRNNLSTKNSSLINAGKKNDNSNPFVVYGFYDALERIIAENNLKASQIWNCDESRFYMDAKGCKVVSCEPPYKITSGAGRDNISTLAVWSAAGKVLDPFIVFSGQKFKATWIGHNTLPATLIGISPNGWMNSEVFFEWFEKFTSLVEERPLLLVFDGHFSHLSVDVIELAIEENIILLKLPSHSKDKLKSSNACEFSHLKRKWDNILNKRLSDYGPGKTLTKARFVDSISDIWHLGLNPINAKSGFVTSGIYPVNRSKFPVERFSTTILNKYNEWVNDGRPEIKTSSKTLSSKMLCTTASSNQVSLPQNDTLQAPTSICTSTSLSESDVLKVLGPKPDVVLKGYKWKPMWVPVKIEDIDDDSIGEIFVDTIQHCQPISKKRRTS